MDIDLTTIQAVDTRLGCVVYFTGEQVTNFSVRNLHGKTGVQVWTAIMQITK